MPWGRKAAVRMPGATLQVITIRAPPYKQLLVPGAEDLRYGNEAAIVASASASRGVGKTRLRGHGVEAECRAPDSLTAVRLYKHIVRCTIFARMTDPAVGLVIRAARAPMECTPSLPNPSHNAPVPCPSALLGSSSVPHAAHLAWRKPCCYFLALEPTPFFGRSRLFFSRPRGVATPRCGYRNGAWDGAEHSSCTWYKVHESVMPRPLVVFGCNQPSAAASASFCYAAAVQVGFPRRALRQGEKCAVEFHRLIVWPRAAPKKDWRRRQCRERRFWPLVVWQASRGA